MQPAASLFVSIVYVARWSQRELQLARTNRHTYNQLVKQLIRLLKLLLACFPD